MEKTESLVYGEIYSAGAANALEIPLGSDEPLLRTAFGVGETEVGAFLLYNDG